MKIYIKNLENHFTVCPTQFSFEVVNLTKPGNVNYTHGYVRYRHGGLSLTLSGHNGEEIVEERVGTEYGNSGAISWEEVVEVLKKDLNIKLKEVKS